MGVDLRGSGAAFRRDKGHEEREGDPSAMLTLTDTRPAHNCQGYSRLEFLRDGGLALGGLTLAGMLSAK
jgi:hypothetical protein